MMQGLFDAATASGSMTAAETFRLAAIRLKLRELVIAILALVLATTLTIAAPRQLWLFGVGVLAALGWTGALTVGLFQLCRAAPYTLWQAELERVPDAVRQPRDLWNARPSTKVANNVEEDKTPRPPVMVENKGLRQSGPVAAVKRRLPSPREETLPARGRFRGDLRMPRTVEAVLNARGEVILLEDVHVESDRRVLVTVLDEPPASSRVTGNAISGWSHAYELVRVLADGGMGRVFVARHRTTGEVVCIKELLAKVNRAALQQECRALAKLRHPSIIRLLNFDARGDHPYLILEYGVGVRLQDYISRRVLAQAPLAAAVAHRLFDAVAYAHRENVVHRDLKPENVLVSESAGQLLPKILDFGLALVDNRDDREAVTGQGIVAGTLTYMAPEQFTGQAVPAACDVYALGQICCEMLSGRRAFSGQLPDILRAKVQRDGLDFDAPLLVPEEFRQLITDCTRRDPARRPTAAEAAQRLNALVPHGDLAPWNLQWSEGGPGMPAGWCNGVALVAGVSTGYDSKVIEESGRSVLRVSAAEIERNGFGVLMQRVSATHLAGTRVTVEAELRTENVTEGAALWLRADGDREMLAFDNMRGRWRAGTTEWSACSMTLDVPAGTSWLNFGVLHSGGGTTFVSAIRLWASTPAGERLELGLGDSDVVATRLSAG